MIDAGYPGTPELPDFDIEGTLRILGASVDIGAYEYDNGADKTAKIKYTALPAPCRILDTRNYTGTPLPINGGVAREVFPAAIAGQGGNDACAAAFNSATALVVALSAVSPTFPAPFPTLGYGTLLNAGEMANGWTFAGTVASQYQEFTYDTPPYNQAASIVWDQDTRLITTQAVVSRQLSNAAPGVVIYSSGPAHFTLDVVGYYGAP